MAEEHFFPVGDFASGLSAAPFFNSGPYAPPPGFDVAAAMAPFGMLRWAADLPLPSDSAATATTAHFDSALSSLVSSPAHGGGVGGDDVAIIGDLIGRLGSICNNAAASANNSCYSTPLSSPPRGAFRQGGCYLETGGGRLSRVASSKSLGAAAEAETSPTAAAAGNKTETPAKGSDGSGAARKRKASSKGKTAAAVTSNGSPKRPKVAGDGNEDAARDAAEEEKPPEPVKDYIHVRARRGQATDSHSLAERVRREKISERMKLLQSLVPGCNKITGKALMLDEIINYVQSLQRQVEFLSMKLSTMNPHQLDVDAPEYLPSDKDMMMHHQPAMPGYPHHQDAGAAVFSYGDPFAAMHPTTMESCTSSSFHPAAGGFGGWETSAAAAQDLHSIVQRPHDGFHGGQQEAATVSHMKVEP